MDTHDNLMSWLLLLDMHFLTTVFGISWISNLMRLLGLDPHGQSCVSKQRGNITLLSLSATTAGA